MTHGTTASAVLCMVAMLALLACGAGGRSTSNSGTPSTTVAVVRGSQGGTVPQSAWGVQYVDSQETSCANRRSVQPRRQLEYLLANAVVSCSAALPARDPDRSWPTVFLE